MSTSTFVFIHGGAQGSWVWDETIAALASQTNNSCRTLALDAPGCGTKRGRDTSAISYEDVVKEFIADIEAAEMHDVVLVGHSQAGTVLPWMAELRPDLFKRLIFTSCVAPLSDQTVIDVVQTGLGSEGITDVAWFAEYGHLPAAERNQIVFCHDMNAAQSAKLIAAMEQDKWPMSSYSQRGWRYDHLATIPTSYIVLLQDRALPASWQRHFATRFHADRIISLDAGHQGMISRPHAFAEALLAEAVLTG